MSVLRIYGNLLEPALHCRWALFNAGAEAMLGDGQLADLPKHAERCQLLLPAAQVLLMRARIPHGAKRHASSLLAFALEEQTASEPDTNHVSYLGAVGDEDVLAVIDKRGLATWLAALSAVGVVVDEVHCETLLLNRNVGEWSLQWNGSEGMVRTGEFEGAATDMGDRDSPPMLLGLLLDEAKTQNALPSSIALYVNAPEAVPDLQVWQAKLGVDLRNAGVWNSGLAASEASVSLVRPPRRWRALSGLTTRLRPALWIVGATLLLHTVALLSDWALLASQQRSIRQQMVTQFRQTFPDAVAVADPVLQMRRKLSDARHAAGQPDSSDFLPMIERVGAVMQTLPLGSVRAVAYESGRMTLELLPQEVETGHAIEARLRERGLKVESPATVGTQRVVIVSAP